MRDYVEWIGLMAVSGSLAVLLNTLLFSGVAQAQMPTHGLTSSSLPRAELCLWVSAPSRP
ncbi:MAG: hypothetical protein VKI82_14035 [Leptolyngbya sp.]|nr:hypothetical protein [Leptolyngbya sp.]